MTSRGTVSSLLETVSSCSYGVQSSFRLSQIVSLKDIVRSITSRGTVSSLLELVSSYLFFPKGGSAPRRVRQRQTSPPAKMRLGRSLSRSRQGLLGCGCGLGQFIRRDGHPSSRGCASSRLFQRLVSLSTGRNVLDILVEDIPGNSRSRRSRVYSLSGTLLQGLATWPGRC
mgnify:CR=1 FL=1